MQNRVTVRVGDSDYTLLTADGEEYVRRVADYVNDKLAEATGPRISRVDSALLTALNIADELLKEQDASQDLRRQLKDLLEESSRLKLELSEAKREIFKLQQKK